MTASEIRAVALATLLSIAPEVEADELRGDRSLTLRHFAQLRRPLDDSSKAVLEHVAYLWGFTVRLEGEDAHGKVSLIAERMREKRSGRTAAGP